MNAPSPPRRLERLRTAVSAHNWFSVAIEIAIVTVGVLLAFEIEQWGQRRQQAEDERQFLERLWRETATVEQEASEAVKFSEERRAELIRVVRAYERRDQRSLQSHAQVRNCAFFILPALGHSDPTARELLISGRLNIIADPRLRDTLATLAAKQVEAAEALDFFRTRSADYPDSIDPYNRVTLAADTSLICQIDWAAALADPNAFRSVVRMSRIHFNLGHLRREVLTQTRQSRALLACKLGKPECKR